MNNIYATYVEIVKKIGINIFNNIEHDDLPIQNKSDIIYDENSNNSKICSDEEILNIDNKKGNIKRLY